MLKRFGYRSALYLSALIAVVHGSYFAHLLMHPSRYLNGIEIYVAAAVAVFLGIWLLSQVARYAGVVFYLFSAGAVAVPLLRSLKTLVMSIGLLWSITMGVLSLGTALILVLSRSFAREFEAEREKRPTYKKHLLRALAILIVVWAVTATLIDIANLVN
jgi:hypothetical protein